MLLCYLSVTRRRAGGGRCPCRVLRERAGASQEGMKYRQKETADGEEMAVRGKEESQEKDEILNIILVNNGYNGCTLYK